MAAKPTVRIRMLGNAWGFDFQGEYDVDEDVANKLTGMGYAELVPEAAASEGE